MNKLTRREASLVLAEALRLQSLYKKFSSRLGQAIHWASSDSKESKLDSALKSKLMVLLDSNYNTDDDFFYWTDENAVTQTFYELYVEQY